MTEAPVLRRCGFCEPISATPPHCSLIAALRSRQLAQGNPCDYCNRHPRAERGSRSRSEFLWGSALSRELQRYCGSSPARRRGIQSLARSCGRAQQASASGEVRGLVATDRPSGRAAPMVKLETILGLATDARHCRSAAPPGAPRPGRVSDADRGRHPAPPAAGADRPRDRVRHRAAPPPAPLQRRRAAAGEGSCRRRAHAGDAVAGSAAARRGSGAGAGLLRRQHALESGVRRRAAAHRRAGAGGELSRAARASAAGRAGVARRD